MLRLILKMADSANVTIGDGTIKVYLQELRGYSQRVIDRAGQRVIREWSEPSKMPTLAFILERCASAQHEQSADDLFTRSDKPPGWEPLTPELKAEFSAALVKAKQKFPATTRDEK